MGLFEIKIFSKFPKITANVKNLNFFKSLIFGMCFSISMTPCVGTFLSSSLLLIASGNSIIQGIILMLLFSLGLGLPFIISCFLIQKLKNVFDIIKRNYNIIKIVSGLVLVIMGLYIIVF